MSLAPEVQSLLEWGEELNQLVAQISEAERRQMIHEALDARMRATGIEIDEVAETSEFVVPVTDGQVQLRVFTPFGDAPHPAFLHIHGGGFVLGTIDSVINNAKCAHICRYANCVVATVEYRLAPEFPFPTAPEDCFAALEFIVDHACELGVDATRIAVGGESAGGNLAAVVALMTRDRGGPPLVLQLLEAPVTDMSDGRNEYTSVSLFGEGYGLDRTDMEAFRDAYLPTQVDGSNPYASPLLAEDLDGVPRAHILTAEFDVLRDSGEALARFLQEAGVRTSLHRFKGQTHGSPGLWQTWRPARLWMDEVVAALQEAFFVSEPVE